MHVLFVCTGNICRSPTAERLSSALAAEAEIPDFRATSAGTQAVIGHPIHHEAARVLESLGGDPHGFAARQLNPRIAADADLVLTMTREHRDIVLGMAPRLLQRTFTLAEAARLASDTDACSVSDLAVRRPYLASHEVADVLDPIGQNSEVFEEVGEQIAELLVPIVDLCRRAWVSGSDGRLAHP